MPPKLENFEILEKMKKTFVNVTTTFILTSILGLTLFFVLPQLPFFANWYQVILVRSGSMEPAISTGSLVMVKPDNYIENDIVAFYHPNGEGKVVTLHRILGVQTRREKHFFLTQGDANQDQDFYQVEQSEVIGKVFFVVPLIGYWLGWFQTKQGLIMSIVAPLFFLLGRVKWGNLTKVFLSFG